MFKPITILIILAIIFGGIYFWLVTPVVTDANLSLRFDWPDEAANYFWIKNYAQTGQFAVFEPLNLVAKNQIHPRSFNVRDDGSLVPGSFLGLILFYGLLGKVFGSLLIIYFTPIFAVFGALAFYSIIKKFFDQKIALISAILLLFHPAWWYYSVTSLLPNVVFISLVLISLYFLLKIEKTKFLNLILSAFFAGLAVLIRPAELVWLLAIYLVFIIYQRKKLNLIRLTIFLALIFLLILPVLYHQQILFGDFLVSGYDQLQTDEINFCQTCKVVQSILLPFGFHPAQAVYNFWTHFVSRFWWWSLLAILGLVAYLVNQNRQKTEIFVYLLLSLFVFGWLIIYYGSWQFSDLLTVHLNTLGLSYVRYFLPLYILALPFVALGLLWLISIFKHQFQTLALIILTSILFYHSANLVLYQKADSIMPVRNRILSYQQIASEVNNLTPAESVIVTIRKDKVFFPERRVIHSFDALADNQELQEIILPLINQTAVYYYALEPESSLEVGNLKLAEIKKFGQEILYQVQLK
ncbi:MAG: hypothetical protein A3D39_02995 [Candidatus Buchananbacteria bacterium RIFCSPHIGHO2_02_FULL_39_17]|nr:MAG: hypothetical protein A3D39_02995 [Candidatus Buchananbacteria bacterium RIFCSPHIGHO2_02_FULL_39_17]